MYNFVDTTEASEGLKLPSEALKLNGEYIENLISGYRTLHVAGREALSPDVTSYTTGVRDGSKIKNKRYPERIIVVTYQIKAASNEEYREAYNKLGRILNVENAELIFNDEQDKFFIGTPCIIDDVTPGRNAVVGKFEILCADPFKYSVVEYEATPVLDDKSILIDYNGTYKAFPTLQAEFYSESEVSENGTAGQLTGNGDCGFVAFFTEDEKIIQLGDPDEIDGSNAYAKSQTLLNQLFQTNTSYGSATQALFSKNSGNVLPADVKQIGSFKMGVSSYAKAASPATTSGTVLQIWSDAGAPLFWYVVTLKSSERTASSVKINATITASLKNDSNYFGYGFGLQASLYIGGAWRNVTLKTTSDWWEGRTGHTANIAFTISGLSATQTLIDEIKFRVSRTDGVGGAAGILSEKSCSNFAISQYAENTPGTHYLTADSYGSANGVWHGAFITKTLPADSSGVVGAKDFTATQGIRLGIGNNGGNSAEMGALQVQICDASGRHIAGFRLFKNKVGTTGTIHYFVDGTKVIESSFDFSYNNEVFGAKTNGGTATISKSGNQVTFSVGNDKKVFYSNTIIDWQATRITYGIEQYSGNVPLSFNGFNWVKFVKNNCNTLKDIPNKFSANDVVKAVCRNGEIYLNNVLSPELGALGNDWEGFALTPGLNQIGFAYSDWIASEDAPKIKILYREVFL